MSIRTQAVPHALEATVWSVPHVFNINNPSAVEDVSCMSRIELLPLPGWGCGTPRYLSEVSNGRGLKWSVSPPTAASAEL